jgi:predicted metal-dependent hydrolase
MKEVVQLPSLPRSKKEYESLRQDLLRDMQERVRRIEERLHVAHTRMVVRRARTRWGSCSRRGTISFSAHLAFLPAEVREYVAVHEVCHLVEHNHSRAFWELVRTLCPEYDVHKKTLRRFRM